MTSKQNKLAIIGPEFFSYANAIVHEINRRGTSCTFFDERHSNTTLSKILYRLQLGFLLKKKRKLHLDNIINSIISNKVTDAILISPEVANKPFVIDLKKAGVRVHLYVWDSFRNKKSCFTLLNNIKNVASFDPTDCKNHSLTYIPLFAERAFRANQPIKSRKKLIIFSGTLHSNRPELLIKLEKILKNNGFSFLMLAYYYTKWLYVIKSLKNPSILRYLFKFSISGFTKKQIAKKFFESKAVIDFHHNSQDGLTSRTFEALRAGCWLISFNKSVEFLPENLRKRVIYLEEINQLSDNLSKLKENLTDLNMEDDYYLSLERFVDDLLIFIQKNKSAIQ